MKAAIEIKEIPQYQTTTEARKVKLVLVATGTKEEIKKYVRQIKKIQTS